MDWKPSEEFPTSERREVRITIRLKESEHRAWLEDMRRAGEEELSRYIRSCANIGRNLRKAGILNQSLVG